jgi:hypothetical protein
VIKRQEISLVYLFTQIYYINVFLVFFYLIKIRNTDSNFIDKNSFLITANNTYIENKFVIYVKQ